MELAATAQCTLGEAECVQLMYGSLALKFKQLEFKKSADFIENVNDSVEGIVEAFSGLPKVPKCVRLKRGVNQTHQLCIRTRLGLTLAQEIYREVESMKWSLGYKKVRK
jgi:hypothetical protein